jgi:phospholipid/cholesterol/gamma-HCH transport system substrate-binding protein
MSLEAKVGFFVVLILGMLFVLTTQVNEFKNMNSEGYLVRAVVDDSTGLEINSRVKMNGINIGRLESFSLAGEKVVLNLLIDKGFEIPVDSEIYLSQESLLGSKIVSIFRGKNNKQLANGDTLNNYKSFASFEKTSDNIYQASEEFKKLAQEVRATLNEDSRKEIQGAIYDIAMLLKEIREVVRENRLGVKSAIDNANKTAKNLAIFSARLPEVVRSFEETIQKYKNIGITLDKELPDLLSSAKSLVQEINGTVAENRKPLNQSLNSVDSFFTKGEESIKKLDKILASITESQIQLSSRGEYNLRDKTTLTTTNIAYLPNPETYYLLGLVSTPDFSEIQNYKLHDKGKTLVSVQYGKKYNNWLFRAGLIESTGGFGAEYFGNGDKWRISGEVFDFNAVNDLRNKYANFRTLFRYRIYDHVDLYTGGTNLLNNERSINFGVGFYFIDNDLKIIAGSMGSLF